MSIVNDESMFESVDIKRETDDDEEDIFKSAFDSVKNFPEDDSVIENENKEGEQEKKKKDEKDVPIEVNTQPTDEKSDSKPIPPSVFNDNFSQLPTIQLSQTKNILSPISPLEESVPHSDEDENGIPSSSSQKKNKIEKNNNNDEEISIQITEPNKIGEGYSSYVAYRVETRTNIKDFRRPESIVPRRFSDFLALHEKLVDKHLKAGRIVPPAPGKDIMGTTKLKMSAQPDQEQDFVEKRRKALERYLQRTAAHPVLRDDPDFREFLEADGELPRATNTSALSSAGMLRFINRFGETVQKLSFKMDESDQWFADKTLHLDNIESQLSHLHFSIDNLVVNRRELSLLSGHFGKSIALLSNIEEHVTLSRVLAKFSEHYEKLESLYLHQSNCDFDIFCELFKDYVALVGSVKEAFHARVKIYQTWQSWQVILNKKRETKVKLELSGRSDKSMVAASEVTEWEHKVERCQEDFNTISAMIKREYEQFEVNRVEEFKCVISKYIEELMSFQQQSIKYWQSFIPEIKTIQLKSSTTTSNN